MLLSQLTHSAQQTDSMGHLIHKYCPLFMTWSIYVLHFEINLPCVTTLVKLYFNIDLKVFSLYLSCCTKRVLRVSGPRLHQLVAREDGCALEVEGDLECNISEHKSQPQCPLSRAQDWELENKQSSSGKNRGKGGVNIYRVVCLSIMFRLVWNKWLCDVWRRCCASCVNFVISCYWSCYRVHWW